MPKPTDEGCANCQFWCLIVSHTPALEKECLFNPSIPGKPLIKRPDHWCGRWKEDEDA